MRYQDSRPKKHFIAGAICPKCKQQDVVVLHRETLAPAQNLINKESTQNQENETGENLQKIDNLPIKEWISCVNCGYTETRPDATNMQQSAHIQNTNIDVSVVKFFS